MREREKACEKARNADDEEEAPGAHGFGGHRLTRLVRRLQRRPSVKQTGTSPHPPHEAWADTARKLAKRRAKRHAAEKPGS